MGAFGFRPQNGPVPDEGSLTVGVDLRPKGRIHYGYENGSYPVRRALGEVVLIERGGRRVLISDQSPASIDLNVCKQSWHL